MPPTASLKRTVQLMVDQSLKGLKDRLFRSIHPPPPPVDVQNISLPSPRGPPPLQPGDGIRNSTYANHDDFTQAHGAADSAPAMPLCSPTPLPPIPQKVRQRIIHGEYIEFDSLLREALFPAWHGTSPSPTLSFHVSHVDSAEGEMVISQRRPRHAGPYATWLRGWRRGTSTSQSWWLTCQHARQPYSRTNASYAKQPSTYQCQLIGLTHSQTPGEREGLALEWLQCVYLS